MARNFKNESSHAKLVQEWLALPGRRIKLHFIPTYCPHLNPIERLWGLMHRNVTHNKCYATCAQFADATLSFLREKVPGIGRTFVIRSPTISACGQCESPRQSPPSRGHWGKTPHDWAAIPAMSIFARPLGLFNDLEPIEMHFDWRRGGKTTGGGPLAAGTDAATDCLSLGSRREARLR